MNNKIEYAVVDLKERKIKIFATQAEAWGTWQNCWVGKPVQSRDRYTTGKLSNMKGYLTGKKLPLSYQDDGLESKI